MKQLFCDCKTDEEKANFFLSGRAVETGIIAPAISNDVSMAYHRCAEFQKEIDALRTKIEQMERQEPVAWRTFDGEGGYDYRSYEDNENYKLGWDARNPNHIGWVEPLYALPGAQPAPIEQDTSVRKAWARFSNELHRSPDAPYPGMADAFEQHFSQSFTDREWRAESATWAAAWKAAKRHGAQPAPSGLDVDTLAQFIRKVDAAHQKALAASALRVAEGWERKCGELRAEVIYWKEQKEPGAAGWRALARILQAKIDAMEKQEPIGGMLEVSPHNYELRWYRPVPFGTKLYTLPGAQPAPSFADAYQGAMEEVAIWKKRALEAEDLNRKFVAEINGPTYMGGPAQPAPSVPDGWKLVPIEPTDEMLRAIRAQRSGARKGRGDRADWKAWLAAAPGDKS